MAIRELDPVVASRIAAGEVVERPASVLRELVDNSIDAGATTISVYVEEGGIRSLTVSDDGCGIQSEELPLAFKSHATSKISTLDDLFNLKTLGFRGEALSSICTCSKLTIASNGFSMTVDNGRETPVLPSGKSHGTMVTMENLFSEIPARLLFLKRASSEEKECRKVFVEKALGFPGVAFRYFVDGKMEMNLQASTRKDRAVSVMGMDSVLEMEAVSDNIVLRAVSSTPETHRRDRTQIKVFVNNRVIDTHQLVQAITNAYSVAIPGGAFPCFYLFIEDKPELVDFNVHPAKREARIRNISEIYGMLTTMIRKALTEDNRKKTPAEEFIPAVSEPELPYSPTSTPHPVRSEQPQRTTVVSNTAPTFDPSWFDKAKQVMAKAAQPVQSQTKPSVAWKYIGQAFNTFLVVETGDDVLFIDQHAAHERILYDEITALRDVQRLIVPYRFETAPSTDEFLVSNSFIYQELGVELVRVEPMLWEIASVPAVCRKDEEYIASYIRNRTGDVEDAKKGLFAIIACKAAIKAGDPVDSITANSLIEKAFALDAMVCPHGRSFVFKVSRSQLYREVGRTV